MKKVTTRIERTWLAKIIAGEKKVEHREMKPYWDRIFDDLSPPFQLRLINGMQENAPEVTVIIDRIRRNGRARQYDLHIGRVVKYSNWDRRRGLPTVSASRRLRAPT